MKCMTSKTKSPEPGFISSCLEKLITRKEKHMKLTRFLFSQPFEVLHLNCSSCIYLSLDNGVMMTSKCHENKNLGLRS